MPTSNVNVSNGSGAMRLKSFRIRLGIRSQDSGRCIRKSGGAPHSTRLKQIGTDL